MKFKIDENLPTEAADILREAGHDAVTVLNQGLLGSKDELIADICRSEQRIILTLDLDFANIHTYPPHQFPGFIVLRSHQQDKYSLLELVRRIVPLLSIEAVEHSLWIVEETGVRIRRIE